MVWKSVTHMLNSYHGTFGSVRGGYRGFCEERPGSCARRLASYVDSGPCLHISLFVLSCGKNISNASSDYILKNANSMAESLTKNDTAVLIVGTNDVTNCTPRHDRPAVTLPGHLLRFIRANQYTNWVVVSLPHRFDLPPRCYTNKLVNQVNHRLKSLTKEGIKVIDSRRLERKHFTRHGLHLDATGKEVLCGLIAQCVSSPFPQRKDQLECQQPTTSVALPDTGNSPVKSGVTDIMPSVDSFGRTPAPVERTTATASPPLDSLSEFPPLQPGRRSMSGTGSLGDADSEYGSDKRIPVLVNERFLDVSQQVEVTNLV
ncbi:hypothetical protein J6590_074418 [Homalodisca vitripennis]|nr:hypothetical protein J6590_074418 [Homalodisca vitripennis]